MGACAELFAQRLAELEQLEAPFTGDPHIDRHHLNSATNADGWLIVFYVKRDWFGADLAERLKTLKVIPGGVLRDRHERATNRRVIDFVPRGEGDPAVEARSKQINFIYLRAIEPQR